MTSILGWFKRCRHDSFYETMSCDAICMDCGKNLGFIGDLDRTKCVVDNDPDAWNKRPTRDPTDRE